MTKVRKTGINELIDKFGVLLALLAVCIIMMFLSDAFLTYNNIINIIRQVSVIGLLAIGETLVVITGEIDLSIGSTVGLSGVITAMLIKANVPLPLCLLAGLASGLLVGLVNGLLIAYGNVPSFVTTLGMMGIARGFSLVISGGYPISSLGDTFRFIGGGEILFIPTPMILLICMTAIIQFILMRSRFGRNLYAVGGSRKAALYTGIRVEREVIKAFALSGVFAALGGIVLAARLNAAETIAGNGYEQLAIAATVIGGASLRGGKGTVVGTLLGTIIIGVINNGMTLLAVQAYWQQIVQGAIIVLAVLLNTAPWKNRGKPKI